MHKGFFTYPRVRTKLIIDIDPLKSRCYRPMGLYGVAGGVVRESDGEERKRARVSS